jgi:hypothetical protein
VGALELLPLSANLLLLQRSTAAQAHSTLSGMDAMCSTFSTAGSAGGQPCLSNTNANSSSSSSACCSSGAQHAHSSPYQHWGLTAALGGSWFNSRTSGSSHLLCWWLLLAGISRLLLPLLASQVQLAGLRTRARVQHTPAAATAALQS